MQQITKENRTQKKISTTNPVFLGQDNKCIFLNLEKIGYGIPIFPLFFKTNVRDGYLIMRFFLNNHHVEKFIFGPQ